jgi:hypothetical protein
MRVKIMIIRKLFLTTLILSIVLTLSACNKTKKETESVEIHIMKSWVNINPYYGKAWNKALNAEFGELLSADDTQIPLKLHELALKLDLELNRLRNADDLT